MTGSPAEPELPRRWVDRVAGSLTHRNFRLLWFAALGSTIGTWMQKYAQGLVVFDLTQSKFYLGMDDLLSQLPIVLFMLIGGVIADRHDRRRLLTGSQYVQAFSAFSLALLYWSGRISHGAPATAVWFIFALSFISGCGQAFGGPAYQSLIPSLVPKRDLTNAIALNSSQFNLSRVLGPSAGGIVLATLGATWCFGLNGVSFFLVVIALAALHLPPHQPAATHRSIGEELKSGLRYVRDNRVMFTLTWLVTIATFLVWPLTTMLPAFASEVLTSSSSPETRLWLLMASQGLGAIVGALLVSSATRNMGRVLLGVQFVLGLLITGFALSTSLPLSLVLLFASGMLFMALFSISFSLVQQSVPDGLRGRVVSIYMVLLRGGGPIGGAVTGALADSFSLPTVMAANGIVLAVLAASMFVFKRGSSLNTV